MRGDDQPPSAAHERLLGVVQQRLAPRPRRSELPFVKVLRVEKTGRGVDDAKDHRVALDRRAAQRTRERSDLVPLREIAVRERETLAGRVRRGVVVVDALRRAAVGDDPENRQRRERGDGEDERQRAPHATPRTLSMTARARRRQSSYASIVL